MACKKECVTLCIVVVFVLSRRSVAQDTVKKRMGRGQKGETRKRREVEERVM